MNTSRPLYFYLSYIFIAHPLILQKIVALTNIFTDKDPNCRISYTNITNGFFSLIVESTEPINLKIASSFESKVEFLEGVTLIYTQETIDADKVGYPYPPTYVYSVYYSLSFSFLSYYFGQGLLFRLKLKNILEKINKDRYFLKVFPTELTLVIESTKPFDPADLKILQTHLNNQNLQTLTSYSNFLTPPSTTPA